MLKFSYLYAYNQHVDSACTLTRVCLSPWEHYSMLISLPGDIPVVSIHVVCMYRGQGRHVSHINNRLLTQISCDSSCFQNICQEFLTCQWLNYTVFLFFIYNFVLLLHINSFYIFFIIFLKNPFFFFALTKIHLKFNMANIQLV